MELIEVSYEQCRLEFFEEQLAAAKRKLDWAVKHNPDCYACMEKGEAVAFFEWAVEKAQQEVVTDNNVGSKTNSDRIRAMTDKELAGFLAGKFTDRTTQMMMECGKMRSATEISTEADLWFRTWMQYLRMPAEVE